MLNNVLNIVENEQSSEFYPTPASLVEKMISGIHWESVKTILEPSAGKGDIVDWLIKMKSCIKENIDCIEIDPNLQHILKGKNFRLVHDDFLTFDTCWPIHPLM